MPDFIGGCVIGSMLFAAVVAFTPGSILYKYHAAKDVCELELPRDEECVMYFKREYK